MDADFSGMVWSGLDCDDDLALLALLAETADHPERFSVPGVSVCGGNAPLAHTWKNTEALWKHVNFDAIQSTRGSLHKFIEPKKGYGWRSMQVSRKWLRLFHALAPDIPDSEDGIDAIVEHVTQHATERRRTADSPNLTLLTLGPPTNVARAVAKMKQQQSDNQNNVARAIDHVYMMGGEFTGQRLDLNFVSDRAAARMIIDSQYFPKTLITIQLCAQVIIDDVFVDYFERQCCNFVPNSKQKRAAAACAILPKMRQQVQLMPRFINPSVLRRFPESGRWTPSRNIMKGFVPWDVIAVLVITQPDLFDDFEYHRVALPECAEGEPCDETMTVLEDLGRYIESDNTNYSGIVRVPHKVRNETIVLQKIHSLLCKVPAANDVQPKMMLGFFSQLFGIVLAALLSLLILYWRSPRRSLGCR